MTNLIYMQVASELRQRITAGEYDAPAGMPTEAQLCERLGVSRSSLRRALAILRQEGLVVSRQGSGWQVAPTLVKVRLGVNPSAAPAPNAVGVLELIGHQVTTPPTEVMKVFGLNTDDELLVVERVSRIETTVVHRSETWFSAALTKSIDHDLAAEEPPAQLLGKLGHDLHRFDQFVEAVLSNRRDEELIGLPPGSAVLQVVRTAFDTHGSASFQSKHRHPGASTRIEVDLPTTNNPQAGTVSLTPDA